jgi:transcriptional regulator with XRE-family HTH domain
MDVPRRQARTVRLRRLAAELRALREAAGLDTKAVQELTEINPATLYRIETAKARPQRRTIVALLGAYGVDAEKRDELLELLKQSAEQGWLAAYETELPEPLLHYVSFESEARSIRNYETILVPGLLQTQEYALATVTQAGLPIPDAADVEQRVQMRMQRQELFNRADPLQLWAIVDEAVIHRVVGGQHVMIDQLERLLYAGKAAHITIQVVPFSAGAHAGMPGSFAIINFPDPQDADIVYSDSMAGDLFLETEAEVRRFSAVFEHLQATALSPTDSAQLIKKRLTTLKKGSTP